MKASGMTRSEIWHIERTAQLLIVSEQLGYTAEQVWQGINGMVKQQLEKVADQAAHAATRHLLGGYAARSRPAEAAFAEGFIESDASPKRRCPATNSRGPSGRNAARMLADGTLSPAKERQCHVNTHKTDLASVTPHIKNKNH
jgi:hypothetical protein